MPTASFLIADVQTKLGDPSGNIFTSATLLNWLNEAQRNFALNQLSFRTVDATSVQAGQYAFGRPDDCMMIEFVASRLQIPRVLRRVTPTEYENQRAACPGARSMDPDVWTEMDEKIYVYPAYGASSASTTVSGAITATQTTMTFASAASFPLTGRVAITGAAVEEVEYGLVNKTTGAAIACVRGLAHTTAASGSVLPLNHLPFYVIYRAAPVTLATVTETPELPSCFHEYLELYVMYLAYMQAGEVDKAKLMHEQWDDTLDRVTWINTREHLSQIGVHDYDTQQAKSLYGPR